MNGPNGQPAFYRQIAEKLLGLIPGATLVLINDAVTSQHGAAVTPPL